MFFKKKNLLEVNPKVFFPSAIMAAIFVIAGVVYTKELDKFFKGLQNFLVTNFGWFYILAVAYFLFFIIWLAFSKYGKIKLGKDNDEPEFSYFTWFAMLFSAGIGIGLFFYGVAEPIMTFVNPPGNIAHLDKFAKANEAMKYTFFIWGLHGWGVYILLGLALAYFSYRHKLPLTVRSTLYPILGEKIYGFWGDLIEILAVLGILFGVATSLGLGAVQINTGFQHLDLLSNNLTNNIIIIVVITLFATGSVVSGLTRGIRRLSEINIFIAFIVLLFVFLVGPSTYILRAFCENLGNYFQSFIQLTFETNAFYKLDFQKNWTLFFWAWWIAWSPFVGMFIARISRGRTIREFILGVLLVPSLLTFIWLSVFGNTAFYVEFFGSGGIFTAVERDFATAFFVLLEKYPLQYYSCIFALFAIIIFFVTSSDSASLVIDILTSGGKPNPPVWQKIFWAFSEGIIAIILLVAGGLTAMQTAIVTLGLPFGIVLIVISYSIIKALRTEFVIKDLGVKSKKQGVLVSNESIIVPNRNQVGTEISNAFEIDDQNILSDVLVGAQINETIINDDYNKNWKKRLERLKKRNHAKYLSDLIDSSPAENVEEVNSRLKDFISDVVKPAFLEIEKELKKYDRDININASYYQASIIVSKNNMEELYYGIRGKAYHKFSYSFPAFDPKDVKLTAYAQIVMRSGTGTLHELIKFSSSIDKVFTVEAFVKDKISLIEVRLSFIEHFGKKYIMTIFYDITEIRRLEEKLEVLAASINQVNAVVCILEGGDYEKHKENYYISGSVEKIYGYKKEEFYADNYLLRGKIMHEDFVQGYVEWLTNKNYSQKYKYKIRTKTGETKWCESMASEITYQNKKCIVLIVTEITDRIRREEVLQSKILKIALKMLKKGINIDTIEEITGISKYEIYKADADFLATS